MVWRDLRFRNQRFGSIQSAGACPIRMQGTAPGLQQRPAGMPLFRAEEKSRHRWSASRASAPGEGDSNTRAAMSCSAPVFPIPSALGSTTAKPAAVRMIGNQASKTRPCKPCSPSATSRCAIVAWPIPHWHRFSPPRMSSPGRSHPPPQSCRIQASANHDSRQASPRFQSGASQRPMSLALCGLVVSGKTRNDSAAS